MCTYFALLMKCAIVVNACDSLVNGASAQPDLLRYVLSNTGCLRHHAEGLTRVIIDQPLQLENSSCSPPSVQASLQYALMPMKI